MKIRYKSLWAISCSILALMIVSCGDKVQLQEPPPPEVMVSKPLEKKITDYMFFSGQTSELASVEIRARVEGWLEQTNFKAGALVKEGDLLFTIDSKPFQAQVNQRKAELAAKQADLRLAKTNLNRSKQLLEKASISQLQFDQAQAEALVAEAQVQMAQANLEKAELSLSYTGIKAPMDGRTSRAYVDDGNLVGAGEKTLLTEIVNNDKIYFYFDLSERDYLKLRRMFPEAGQDDMPETVYVAVQLADEKDFPHIGKIDFSEPKLDPGTGTLESRAIFDNEDRVMVAGLFGRIRIPIRERVALLIPEMAISTAQAGQYALVVGKDNVVEQRFLELGEQKGTMRVIEKGLDKNDLVVVNAIQRARPGRPVTPKPSPIEDSTKDHSEDHAEDQTKKKSQDAKVDQKTETQTGQTQKTKEN